LSVFFFLEAMYTTNPSPCSWRLYNCVVPHHKHHMP
jgi:hypothetical protein